VSPASPRPHLPPDRSPFSFHSPVSPSHPSPPSALRPFVPSFYSPASPCRRYVLLRPFPLSRGTPVSNLITSHSNCSLEMHRADRLCCGRPSSQSPSWSVNGRPFTGLRSDSGRSSVRIRCTGFDPACEYIIWSSRWLH
jgi:hypothetical protein